MNKKTLFLGLMVAVSSQCTLAASYKGGFCRVDRVSTADNKNNSNLSWLKLECFDKNGNPVQGKTSLKTMNVPASRELNSSDTKRGFPSYLIIDGQKVANNGPDALDYFDTISGYEKTIASCKAKFPKMSCKNINFLLQPEHNIFERPDLREKGSLPSRCSERSSEVLNCIEKAKDQFAGQDFVQDCSVPFCGRSKRSLARPITEPTAADLQAELDARADSKKPLEQLVREGKQCVPNQNKYLTLKNMMQTCLSGFQLNQSNTVSMYETIAHYLSCDEFKFSSAGVIQEGTRLAAVARNPASESSCQIKIPNDINSSVGYGKIEFKDESGKTISVDWDSKFDSTNSANSQMYWKSDFGRKLMTTFNINHKAVKK